jgi:alpha-D-xyloside xylohydrolase
VIVRPVPGLRRLAPATLLLLLSACGDDGPSAEPDGPAAATCAFRTEADDVAPPPRHTPRWAFEPWISKDISSAADTRDFVAGFRSRDIPVGTVVLDSPWETHYNTFVPHPVRYAGFADLVAELHADEIRIVLWTTQMVNRSAFDLEEGGDSYDGPSPNYAEGQDCDFYVNGGQTYFWWKGFGAGVDFFDPEAVGWWHRQQDALLDLGIDGWKLDFGEEYIAGDTLETAAGAQSKQAYSEAYYADFLAYGAARRGRDEFVTMVRPWDQSYEFAGRFYARPEHAPVAWVGDNRRDWVGLIDALDHLFRSAAAGYGVIGSDIGGYLDHDDVDGSIPVPFDTLVFARWTAMGALMPFMQLHGRANITPWTVPDSAEETVALYRYWATLHSELVPFFYSLSEESDGGAIVHPIGDGPLDWAGDWRYQLGEALLVAPVLDASGRRDVALPEGRWYDWWHPENPAIAGGTTLASYDATDRQRIPLFVREGAILPAAVRNDVTGLGSAASTGALTLLVYPGAAPSGFRVHDSDGEITEVSVERNGGSVIVELRRTPEPVVLRIRLEDQVAAVSADGGALPALDSQAAFDAAESGWWYEAERRFVWVKRPALAGSHTIDLALLPPPPDGRQGVR